MNFDAEKCLKFVAESNNCQITLEGYEFSSDEGVNWSPNTITINAGQHAYVRGEAYPAGKNFVFIKKVHIESGNVMSLVDGGLGTQTTIDVESAFKNLCYGRTNLTSVNSDLLPATQLAASCYNSMFSDCTSLTNAPELPATELAYGCYSYMFNYCSSLETAPELPATQLADSCYYGMFNYCSSLETPPPELPATQLAGSCYYGMFNYCTSLKTPPPELPATQLAGKCYQCMFNSCEALTKAPELKAEQLADNCCEEMFHNCESLKTAPELPATQLAYKCYYNMFLSCASLEKAPKKLPATELAVSCYDGMFYSCTALTKAPELPATELVDGCYGYMFYNCAALTEIKVHFTDWASSSAATENWVDRIADNGTFYCPKGLSDDRGVSRIPTNWDIIKPTDSKTKGSITFFGHSMPIK